jgi:hypothetical protein
MTVAVTPCDDDFPDIIAKESSATSTASEDIFDGPKAVHNIDIDNSANAGSAAVVRLYDALTADNNSVPDMKLTIPQAVKRSITISDGIAFGTGVSIRCTTGQADADVANPGAAVVITATGS